MRTDTELMTEPTIIQLQPSLAARAVEIGMKHHVLFEVMPRLGVLTEPIVINGWRCVPRDQDTSFVPRWADKRVDWLRKEGISVMQEIIMHEPGERTPRDFTREKAALKKVAIGDGVVAMTAAAVCSVVAIAGMYAAATAASVLVIGLDPALVCVLEDGTWICVAEYYD